MTTNITLDEHEIIEEYDESGCTPPDVVTIDISHIIVDLEEFATDCIKSKGEYFSPTELPITRELMVKLDHWRWDSYKFKFGDPEDQDDDEFVESNFDFAAYWENGYKLAKELKNELPNSKIYFNNQDTGQIIEIFI